MSARKSIGKKLRFDVFKRDGFSCVYCGAHPPSVLLHVDHIEPVSRGGTNDIDNLLTACEACNLGKGARRLSDVPPTLAQKAEAIAEREAQIIGYNNALAAAASRIEDDAWSVADVWMSAHGKDSIRKDRFRSIKTFIERLPTPVVVDAMKTAVAKLNGQEPSFRYFCGICWTKIKGGA